MRICGKGATSAMQSFSCMHLPASRNRIRCNCADFNITSQFYGKIQHRLPILRPWVLLEKSAATDSVRAKILTLVTAELLVTLEEDVVETVKEITDPTCTVPNTTAQGCYHCIQGAVANVTCTSDRPTRASINCDEHYFTVSCTPHGNPTQLRFTHSNARLKMLCSVSCGTKTTEFGITGILQWVNTIQETLRRITEGKSNISEEIAFSYMSHIFDVLFLSYKTVIATLAALAAALFFGYLFFWTCGIRIFFVATRIVFTTFRFSLRLVIRVVILSLKSTYRCFSEKSQGEHRDHVKLL
ncbi:unnamed protein product [Nippostrongylus brasiliensis]|uniref:Phlebovirus_G2 domain-containing protein n=1 Tax=Nippostrongylus brasiliensis TaxID=27835 RepID=A0A0N4XTR8_NIPBR|nr:unnamed protein product [Nippostrongylus brasiliensis]